MLIIFRILFITIAFVAECADAFKLIPCFPRVDTRVLSISPEFKADEISLIKAAAETWNTALDRKALVIFSQMKEDFVIVKMARESGIGGSTEFTMKYNGEWFMSGIKVELSHDLSEENLYNVALHEFGHVLGLMHSARFTAMGYVLKLDVNKKPLKAEYIQLDHDDVLGIF